MGSLFIKMMKVMVVDDSHSVVRLIKDILKKKGEEVDVEAFYDGISALDKIKEDDYDFYILDYELPGVDGLSLAKEAEKKVGKDRVLLISAYDDFKHERYKVLHKPFKIQDLLNSLEF